MLGACATQLPKPRQTVFFAFNYGDLVQPLPLLWFLCIAATTYAFRRKQWRSGFAFLFITCIFYAIGATPVPAKLITRLEASYYPADWDSIPSADAILILGGTINASPRDLTGFNLAREADRIITGFSLARQGKAKALVLGGSKYRITETARTEGEHVQHWFQSWGIADIPTYILPECTNTHDEALRTRNLVNEHNWASILLVTSGSHMLRAEATFRAAGIKVIPVACDFEGATVLDAGKGWNFVPQETGFYLMKLYIHEVVGWPYYRLRGWIKAPRKFIG
ncbi:MAG: hypothetical protein M2R45_00949 [Verrucomicrobia subdivision 3 bacterium]|nr:hypothetical protein [Limisphaerales bacterium]MCS1414617.1 hypothetical protein [Limisphaerales bacterium]